LPFFSECPGNIENKTNFTPVNFSDPMLRAHPTEDSNVYKQLKGSMAVP